MPQIYLEKVKSFGNAEIFFWHITENCEELSCLIADNGILLAEAQKKFKGTGRQREWLSTRALLKQTPYKHEEIVYDDNGKPGFASKSKHISISHTAEIAAIAVSDSPIGIDLELDGRNAVTVAKSFLQPQELEALMTSSEPENEALHLWSAKEAAFKFASHKISVLKEIGITKNANNYTITYPDGATAVCSVNMLDGAILSIAENNY